MPTNEQQIKRGEIALGVRPDLSTLPLQMSQDGFLWTAQGGSVSTTGTNTTTTPLSTGATFTGSAELNTFPDVGVSCHTDGGGTLYFDFSNDGTNWNTFPTAGFTVVANILVPGDTLTIAAIAASGTNGEAAASLKLLERL